jgi:hypothetical protein
MTGVKRGLKPEIAYKKSNTDSSAQDFLFRSDFAPCPGHGEAVAA